MNETLSSFFLKSQLLIKLYYSTLLILVIYISIRYLRNPWLWFDESGQFWIAQGLNHSSDPFSSIGGVISVIDNNRNYNLDPGGFSILLHYWVKISCHHIFLRLLPYCFFLLYVFFVYRVIFEYTKSRVYSIAVSFSMFLWDVSLSRMVEIRAYPMEMLGVVLAVFLLIKLMKIKKYSCRQLLLFSFILSFFCTSRYEFIIFSFVLSVVLFYVLHIQKPSYYCLKYIIFVIPLLFTVIILYLFMMRYQNGSAMPVSYVYYLSDWRNIFSHGLFFYYLLNIVLVLYSYFQNKKITMLEFFSLAVPTLIAILSVLGHYPWDSVRSIAVSILLFLNISVFLYHKISVAVSVKIFMLFIFIWTSSCAFSIGINSDLYYDYMRFSKEYSFNKMFVDYRFNSSLRYLYEYGVWKDERRDIYPNRFVFQKSGPFNVQYDGEQRILNPSPETENCNYYVLSFDHEVYDKVFEKIDGFSNIYRAKSK